MCSDAVRRDHSHAEESRPSLVLVSSSRLRPAAVFEGHDFENLAFLAHDKHLDSPILMETGPSSQKLLENENEVKAALERKGFRLHVIR